MQLTIGHPKRLSRLEAAGIGLSYVIAASLVVSMLCALCVQLGLSEASIAGVASAAALVATTIGIASILLDLYHLTAASTFSVRPLSPAHFLVDEEQASAPIARHTPPPRIDF